MAIAVSVGAISFSLILGKEISTRKRYQLMSVVLTFQDSRTKFEVKFYLVAILFIIFDLEIIFLFPWAVAFDQVGLFGFLSMMFFLLFLTIGFAYEWTKGALDWS